MLTGFYLSLVTSISIVVIISFWDFSYISKIYSAEDRWNESLTLRLNGITNGETRIQAVKDVETLGVILDEIKKIPMVKNEYVENLRKSLIRMKRDPFSVQEIMNSFDGFHVLVKDVRGDAMSFLIIVSAFIVSLNVFMLGFLVFRPQRKLLNLVDSISDDLLNIRIGKVLNQRSSGFAEASKLVGSFNMLLEKFAIYKIILNVTERSKTVDELTEELYKNLRDLVNFDVISFAGVKNGVINADITFGNSRNIFVDLPVDQSSTKSSLGEMMSSRKPRILNDLEEYSRNHPGYEILAKLIEGGIRSSLTFPIYFEERCIGFLLLYSKEKNAFSKEDVDKLEIIDDFLSLAYQKTSMTHDLIVSTTTGFTKLAEGKDNETGKHVVRMASYSRVIAEELLKNPDFSHLSPKYAHDIYEQSPLHDIGKVGVPDRVLMKPGKLALKEFEIMKTHTVIGHDILKNVDEKSSFYGKKFFGMGHKIARHHHERWDGRGYPDGLAGKDIPLCARIVAVADVFDALTSKRPYKEPIEFGKSYEMIIDGSGKQFDPAVVGAFVMGRERIMEIYEIFKENE